MSRRLLLAAGVLSATLVQAILADSRPALAEASTIRIETKAAYGATVTVEHGVRVYRPLPPHKYVVINPGGRTPLSLSLEESNSVSYNYDRSASHSHVSSEERGSGDSSSVLPNVDAPRRHRHGGAVRGPHHRDHHKGGGH